MRSVREVVTFTVGGHLCALDVAVVDRVEPMVTVRELPDVPPGVLGAVSVHGEAVAVLDLRERLGLPAAGPAPGGALLLARTSRRPAALPVDEVLGLRTVDTVTSPDALGLSHTAIAGVTALGDGLLLIHDLE